MKVYFRQICDSDTWLMYRFYDGSTCYNFRAEQHRAIHDTISELFKSAKFLSRRGHNTVTLYDEADAAFFHLWADKYGVDI